MGRATSSSASSWSRSRCNLVLQGRFAPRRDLLLPPVLAVEECSHTPWGNFLLVQKVTKNTLRGFAPKNPGFLEQGRGAFSLADRIGRAITYGPRHFPVVRLPAASAQVLHRLFPPNGENALAPLCHLRAKRRRFATVALRNARLRAGVLSPPDPLRWAPAGAPSR